MKKYCLNLFLLLFLLILQAGCSTNPYQNITNIDSATGTTLVCFGDSLTSGQGAKEGEDYPSVLKNALALPVINSGKAGDTTYSALDRVQADVLSRDPKVVIVELGANDFLLWKDAGKPGYKLEDSFRNIETMIDRIQSRGAVAVLAAIPFDYEYKKGYEGVARKKGALLIPDIMKGLIGNSDLMSLDRVHPNGKGYRVMAETISKYVRPLIEEMK